MDLGGSCCGNRPFCLFLGTSYRVLVHQLNPPDQRVRPCGKPDQQKTDFSSKTCFLPVEQPHWTLEVGGGTEEVRATPLINLWPFGWLRCNEKPGQRSPPAQLPWTCSWQCWLVGPHCQTYCKYGFSFNW